MSPPRAGRVRRRACRASLPGIVLDGVWRLELRARDRVAARLPIDQDFGVRTSDARFDRARRSGGLHRVGDG